MVEMKKKNIKKHRYRKHRSSPLVNSKYKYCKHCGEKNARSDHFCFGFFLAILLSAVFSMTHKIIIINTLQVAKR